jgi:hypothetical protein
VVGWVRSWRLVSGDACSGRANGGGLASRRRAWLDQTKHPLTKMTVAGGRRAGSSSI